MKSIYKKIAGLGMMALMLSLISCDENDGLREPKTTVTNVTSSTANFFFINATADGGPLDFYVNGLQIGGALEVGKGQNGYVSAPLSIVGFSGANSLANTSIRAKASAGGSIGGVLKTSDLIYRAGNTNSNNLVAAPNARYTFIAVDEVNRPAPLRTFSLNPLKVLVAADTYYNPITRQQFSKDQFDAIQDVVEKAKFSSIGLVPAGATDVGGTRFYALTDTYPTDAAITAAASANQSFIRFVHASPNAPGVFVRLVPTTTGSTINLVTTAVQNVMSVAGGFAPSVGSRTATLGWPAAVATGAATTTYKVEVHTNAAFTALALEIPNVAFIPGKVYTIVARGLVGGTGASALGAAVAQHN
jgi:hypothetical protein